MPNRIMEAIEAGMADHGIIDEARSGDMQRIARDLVNLVGDLDASPGKAGWMEEPMRVRGVGEAVHLLGKWLHAWQKDQASKGVDQASFDKEVKQLVKLGQSLKRASKKVVIPDDED